VPGVEFGAGSLGHGLGVAVGVTLGLRARRLDAAVYVLLGDAELDEGSNHEAIAYAGATGLGGLTAIVIDNDSTRHGWPGGIASRFTVNGWTESTVDGRDHGAIEAGLRPPDPGRPHVLVAVVEPPRTSRRRGCGCCGWAAATPRWWSRSARCSTRLWPRSPASTCGW
jgi:transketolase